LAAQDWKLARLTERYDWSLTNATGNLAKHVYIEFEGVVDGRRWKEGVTPARTSVGIGRIAPGETIYLNIDSSETVDRVRVSWRVGFRTKTWDASSL
jgi:hypothetical protein